MDWEPNKRKFDGDINWTSKRRKIECVNDSVTMGGKSDLDVIKENNHIYFYCEVNRKTVLDLIKYIRVLNSELANYQSKYDFSDSKIFIHINSYGGNIFAAIAVIDTILSSKVPVVSIIEGCCASAGTLISMVCSERIITPNSFMLIHELKSNFWGKMSEIEDEFTNLQQLTELIKNLYKKHTKLKLTGKNGINNILKHDIWWNSNTCLELGLVDKII